MDSSVATMHPSRRAWRALAVLTLPTLLISIDATVLLLALPAISADLAPSASETLWIVDAYGFTLAILLLPMGALGDRIGRRRLLLWGAAAFGAASALAALAPTAEALILARILLGAAASTLMPSTLALISTLFSDARARGIAISIWAAAISVGVAVGPILGGVLLQWFPWGSVFLIGVPVMALLLIVGPLLLPEHRDRTTGSIDPLSVGLALLTAALAIGGVKLLASGEAPVPVSVAALAAGVVLGIVFARRQRRVGNPLVDPRLLREPGVTPALLLMLGGVATLGVYLFVTQYLQQDAGLTALEAGVALLLPALGLVAASLLAPVLAARVGPGPVLTGGFVMMAAGAAGLALFAHLGLAAVVTAFGLYYLGIGPLMALGTDLVVGRASPQRAGSAAAVSESTFELGLALGFGLIGSLGTAILAGGGGGDEVAPVFPGVGLVVAAASVALAIATPLILRVRALAPAHASAEPAS